MNRTSTYTFSIRRAPWNTRNLYQVVAHYTVDWSGWQTPISRVPNGCEELSLQEARDMIATLEAEQTARLAPPPADPAPPFDFDAWLWDEAAMARAEAEQQRLAREKRARAARKGWQARRFNTWLWTLPTPAT